jgi:glycosidase
MYSHRKEVHRGKKDHEVLVSSHGEASRFFVTFLDNHDKNHRFFYADPADPGKYEPQVSMGIGCLFALQGIPCLYYGTEQGLHGSGDSDQSVREALWGKQNAFDKQNSFFKAVRNISAVRAEQPALRYGRQYFREISGNNVEFSISATAPGVIAFSRILNDEEIIVIANASTQNGFSGFVIVDYSLNPPGAVFKVLYSNQGENTHPPGAVVENLQGSVIIHSLTGGTSDGPVRVISCNLEPMEIQILGKE